MPLRIYHASTESAGATDLAPGEAATVARVIKAFEYAADNGAHVVNGSFGHPHRSRAEREAIRAAPEVLFAISAGNSARNVDGDRRNRQFPCLYNLPNLICAAATDNRDRLASFSNWGPKSVDLAAPGAGVFTTSVEFDRTVRLRDRFDQGLAEWKRGGRRGRWGLEPGGEADDRQLADSPRGRSYRNRANSWIRSPAIDLSGTGNCVLWMRVGSRLERRDFVLVEAARRVGDWKREMRLKGRLRSRIGEELARRLDGDDSVYVRFRVKTNRHRRDQGIGIDNLKVECSTPRDGFLHVDGTSFSAPHVAGAAALVLAQDPALETTEVRARILQGVDPLPELDGRVVTGGRLNLAGALAGGG